MNDLVCLLLLLVSRQTVSVDIMKQTAQQNFRVHQLIIMFQTSLENISQITVVEYLDAHQQPQKISVLLPQIITLHAIILILKPSKSVFRIHQVFG
jgi:nitrate reductase gamma subunit